MKIEYHPRKKNPADRPSWHPDYIDAADNKEEKILHTMDYMTRGFIKHGKAQKIIENACQAIQQSEVTSEANTSESHFTDNESLLYDTADNCIEISSSERSNMPNNNLIETRKTSSKHKHKESTKQIKRILPKKREKKKLDETSLDSQPMRLYLMTCDDKMAHVNCEAAKKISEKESIFASLLLEMRQVLQALQETDHFVQTIKLHALEAEPLALQGEEEEKIPILVKSDKFEKIMIWHMKDKFLCYKQRWFIPPGFLHRELLHQHHNNP